ncbi:nitrilase-related carbon-nitrogen hydrolase [Bacteroidota bacterium]
MKVVKIALIQQKASDDLILNLEKGINSVNMAAKNGAKIVCFAELAFSPFYPQIHASKEVLDLAETIPGPTTDIFSSLAKELGLVIILNLFERDGEHTYDSSPVINSDGQILGTTRMIHITDYEHFHEQAYYHPGENGAPVYNTEFGKIAVAICYDRHYPEYMRALAIGGAEIVFIPQAGAVGEWPDGLYEAEMQVAAFQNGYFTALCNRVGEESKLTFSGESFVCEPSGKVIDRSPSGEDHILYSDIDIAKVKTSHAHRLFLRDRRPELYSDWII